MLSRKSTGSAELRSASVTARSAGEIPSTMGRVFLALTAASVVAAFGVANRLDPDPAGLGTHRQLGLAECPTFERLGFGCPTCGMTTAMALLADGRPVSAFAANPAAVFLGILGLVFTLWAAASSCRGRLYGFDGWDRPLAYWAGGMSAIALTTWAIRMYQWAGMTEH